MATVSRKPAEAMDVALDQVIALAQQLKAEDWDDFDVTLTRACTTLVQRAFHELKKPAKAISRITPAESQHDTSGDSAWWTEVLDNMK